MDARQSFDAVVIGAGVGGLCAAARLATLGYRTLVVEALDAVGGRYANIRRDGFLVHTGGVVIECGGVLEETCRLIGAPFEVRRPKPSVAFLHNGRELDFVEGGWGGLLRSFSARGVRLFDAFRRLRRGEERAGAKTLASWLARYSRNAALAGLFRNLAAAIYAANPEELPADAFFSLFSERGGFKHFGLSPDGPRAIMEGLARAVAERGGAVWCDTTAERILVEAGRAGGVVVRRAGAVITVRAPIVVSNAGPRATVRLAGEQHFNAGYLEQLRRLRAATNISIHFWSDIPLCRAPGLLTFTRTEVLCNLASVSATCPEAAPPGKHLYVAFGVPRPALDAPVTDRHVETMLAELARELPGFRPERVVDVRRCDGEWPAQRASAGFDLPQQTPVAGLYNVGDGAKPFGWAGSGACAESARLAVEDIRQGAIVP